MSFLVIEIDSPKDTIGDLNSKIQRPTAKYEAVVALRDYLDAILNGSTDASVQITTRATTASVSPSGSGATQDSYNFK